MKKIFLLFALVLVFFGCTKETEKPENVLPQETMVRLMADMTMAEAKVKNLRIPSDSSRIIYQEYEKSIFQKWDISAEQYKESYQYYLMNFEEMAEIQNAIIDTLEQRHKKAVPQ